MNNLEFSKPVLWWFQSTLSKEECPKIEHLIGTIVNERYSPYRQYLIEVKPKNQPLDAVVDLSQIVSWRRGMNFIDEVSVLTALASMCDNSEALREHITKVMDTSIQKQKSQMMEDMVDPAYRLDPCIGREREIQELVTALLKRKKSNAVLTGEPGVGKTAIVEGFVQMVRDKQIPEFIGYRVLVIDLATIFSGTSMLGALQEKVKRVLGELRKPRTIGFIDEVHAIFTSGMGNGQKKDVGDMFKPHLANGDIKIIGATTNEEYKEMERDGAIKRRFQKIPIAEPDIETTYAILKGVRHVYAKHHGVSIPDSVIYKAAEMAAKYMHYDKNPDAAIDLIDNTAARVRSSRTGSVMDRLTDVSTSRLNLEHLFQTVYLRTGIEVKDLVKTDFKRMQALERIMQERVLGQDDAIKKVATAVRSFKLGLRNKKKPFVFMFAGVTGCGKTETVKQLTKAVFGNDKSLIRFDMNEFAEPHAVSRLGGSPPGYVGYDEGGQLTEKIKRQPYSIVLLDEWEKAHRVVHQRFLNIFDDGRSEDNHGVEIDFSNCIFILTTNMGVKDAINRKTAVGFNRKPAMDSIDQSIKGSIKDQMPPELLNRIDEVIIFKSEFSKENLATIAKIHLDESFSRNRNFKIEYSPKIVDLVVNRYEKEYGGRSIRRFVEAQLMPPIVDYIVFNEKKHVKVDVKDPASKDELSTLLEITDGEVKTGT